MAERKVGLKPHATLVSIRIKTVSNFVNSLVNGTNSLF